MDINILNIPHLSETDHVLLFCKLNNNTYFSKKIETLAKTFFIGRILFCNFVPSFFKHYQ